MFGLKGTTRSNLEGSYVSAVLFLMHVAWSQANSMAIAKLFPSGLRHSKRDEALTVKYSVDTKTPPRNERYARARHRQSPARTTGSPSASAIARATVPFRIIDKTSTYKLDKEGSPTTPSKPSTTSASSTSSALEIPSPRFAATTAGAKSSAKTCTRSQPHDAEHSPAWALSPQGRRRRLLREARRPR